MLSKWLEISEGGYYYKLYNNIQISNLSHETYIYIYYIIYSVERWYRFLTLFTYSIITYNKYIFFTFSLSMYIVHPIK